jgi:two-component system phosphate regulon sensor histidine kinase PhoR
VWVSFENDARELVILVRDDGPGIPRRDLPRLFERFYRVDKGRSSSMGGTGLGLAIVKHIAGAHGGSVQADSAVGEGSSFILRIPQDHDN